MADWGGLVQDILFMIANRIENIEDFVAFGSVCATWRAARPRELSLQPLRWIMFTSRYGGPYTHDVYSFTRDKIHRVSIPMERLAIDRSLVHTNGWVLRGCSENSMSLLHPVTHHIIDLPPKTTFGTGLYPDPYWRVQRAVLSSTPFLSPEKDYTLMTIYTTMPDRLSFWKPGDKTWNVIKTCGAPFEDIIYCREHFYAIDKEGVIYVCDVRGCKAMPLWQIPIGPHKVIRFHLAGKTANHASMLVVARCFEDGSFPVFKVYEVDLSGKRGVEEVDDLGSRTIFLSWNNDSICVENSRFPPGIIMDNFMWWHDFHCPESYSCVHSPSESNHRHERGIIMYLEDEEVGKFFYPLDSLSVFPPV